VNLIRAQRAAEAGAIADWPMPPKGVWARLFTDWSLTWIMPEQMRRAIARPRSSEEGNIMVLRREDPELVLDAMAYVEAVHRDLTAENTAPPAGVEGRVVAAIRADPALSDYVRTWASERRALEASVAPPQRPPIDATYERVRELLRRAGDEPRRQP
jgi:hypothetical protein